MIVLIKRHEASYPTDLGFFSYFCKLMLLIDFDLIGTLSCGTVGQYCSVFFRYFYFIGIWFIGVEVNTYWIDWVVRLSGRSALCFIHQFKADHAADLFSFEIIFFTVPFKRVESTKTFAVYSVQFSQVFFRLPLTGKLLASWLTQFTEQQQFLNKLSLRNYSKVQWYLITRVLKVQGL